MGYPASGSQRIETGPEPMRPLQVAVAEFEQLWQRLFTLNDQLERAVNRISGTRPENPTQTHPTPREQVHAVPNGYLEMLQEHQRQLSLQIARCDDLVERLSGVA